MATWEFTEAERHQIDETARKINHNETLTTEEALLYARYQAYKAVNAEEFKAEQKRMNDETEAAIEEARKTAQTAREGFEALTALAVERYERTLNNGE